MNLFITSTPFGDRPAFQGYITDLNDNQIFVFGSNPEGRHGAGTAKIAVERFGAAYGKGRGMSEQSYALPTKNLKAGFLEKTTGIRYENEGMCSLTPTQIKENIRELYAVAQATPSTEFLVAYTSNGRNLNGYSSQEMAGFFRDAGSIPANVIFEDKFWQLM